MNNQKLTDKMKNTIKKFKTRFIALGLTATMIVTGLGSCKNTNENHTKDPEPSTSVEQIVPLPSEDPDIDTLEPSKDPVIPSETEGIEDIKPDDNDLVETPSVKPEDNDNNITKPIDGDTVKPSKNPVKDETPSVKPTDKVEVETPHVHEFTEWENDGEKEKRVCLEDGTVEYREHTLEEIGQKILVNNNGTYTIIKQIACTTCDKIESQEIIKPCEFGEWHYNTKTGLDERTCKVSGFTETRIHTHATGKIIKFDDTYEYHECLNGCDETLKVKHILKSVKNKDGSTTYTCTNPECSYTKTVEPSRPSVPSHTHSRATKIEKPSNVTGDYCYEIVEYCTSCGKELSRVQQSHKYKTSVDPVTFETIYTCENDDCSYSYRVAHEHSKKTRIVQPEELTPDYCYIIEEYCDVCSQTLGKTEVEHVLDDGVYNPDTYKVDYSCNECDYVESREHVTQFTKHLSDQDTEEYEVWEDPITHQTATINHNFEYGDYGKCLNDGCDYYMEQKVPSHVHKRETKIEWPKRMTKDYCYEVVEYCSECLEELDRTRYQHVMDYDHPDYQDGNYTEYQCQNGGCSYYEEVYSEEMQEDDTEIIQLEDKQIVLKLDKKDKRRLY